MQQRTTVCREFSTEKHRKNFKQSVKTTVNMMQDPREDYHHHVCGNRVIFLLLLSERTKALSPPPPCHVEYLPWNVHLILIVPGKVRNTRIINSLAASTDEFFNNVKSLISNWKSTNVAENFDPWKGDGKIWTGAKYCGWKDLSTSSRPVFP